MKYSDAPHIQDLIAARMSRRGLVGGLAGLPLLSLASACATGETISGGAGALTFAPIPPNKDDAITVPRGYSARTLIAWGDALFDSVSAAFDPDALTRAEQEQRFGANNDMLALFPARYAFPAPRDGRRHLLCANHEYFTAEFFFPELAQQTDLDRSHLEAMFASMGVSVVEVEERADGSWRVLRDARPGAGRNRRITPFTPVLFEGPAAAHRWIAAAKHGFPGGPRADGAVACGTLANCAGGQTPWGTYLTAEENFNSYFSASNAEAETLSMARADAAWRAAGASFGTPPWGPPAPPIAALAPAQFDVAQLPYGPALYGWIVEIDPYDPNWAPRKRTALGRAKHECATTALSRDGRVAVYSGDDQNNEFVYKFISAGRFNAQDRLANRDLLNQGRLYVARFNEDGSGEWLELTPQAANAAAAPETAPFTDAGDVAIRAREAARLMGATPMDRPEDVECLLDENWVGIGPVLIVCTNNSQPHAGRPGNPRREAQSEGAQANWAGHMLRIDEQDGDCGALGFFWDVFALAGDPAATAEPTPLAIGAQAQLSVNHEGAPTFTGDRFACPDNICFDAARNVWIATDGSDFVFPDCNDAVLAATMTEPRVVMRFLVGPVGCEICGPTMAPDQKTFLVSIQHPGEIDANGQVFAGQRWSAPGARPGSSFPDGGWPRAGVVYVRKDEGGVIGS